MRSLTRNRLSTAVIPLVVQDQRRQELPSIFIFIMNQSFIDNPQIEELMYEDDGSLDQFLNEQGDIMGMNIECNEFDTDMTV